MAVTYFNSTEIESIAKDINESYLSKINSEKDGYKATIIEEE